VVLNHVQIRPVVRTLQEAGIEVSLFVDPELEQVKESHKLDATAVEINTAAWSEAVDARGREAALRKVTDAARLARKLGLQVHAGHGLDYRNVGPIAALTEITELNIGHAIVARAVLVGMERAVREMVEAMRAGRASRV
jgi:pyridoxine 5-phosphate synthase